jgi:hypothetical protein
MRAAPMHASIENLCSHVSPGEILVADEDQNSTHRFQQRRADCDVAESVVAQ